MTASGTKPGTQPAGREIELKLEVRPEDLEKLRHHPRIRSLSEGRAQTRRLRSVYYDTPDLSLASQGIGLRVRRIGDRHVQTVKLRGAATAGLFDRREIECEVSSEALDLARIEDAGIRARLEDEDARGPLGAVIETDFRRTRRQLRLDRAEVLCELDVGEVRARGASAPLCELELELVSGDPSALFDLALELSDSVSLRPASRGKVDVGVELLTGVRPAPRKARKVEVPSDATVEDVWIATARGCLEQILANDRPAREGVDPEGVHQLRVGVRRLRAALSLFGPLLPRQQVRPLSLELRWLGGEMGLARDLDVFLDETFEPLFRRFADDAALKRLREGAREMRDLGYQRVRRALESPRSARLVLGLGRWIASRGWRDALPSDDLERLETPARVAGSALLARRSAKARKLGDRLSELGPDERHRLRIQLKKLRYATEFFRGAFPEKHTEVRHYVERLKDLQDVLGELNDFVIADRLIDEILENLGGDAGRPQVGAAGFVAGWTASRAERKIQELPVAWAAFAEARAFWRPRKRKSRR